MKIIRNIITISLALCLLSNINRKAESAHAAEENIHICSHSACEAEIAILEAELEAAQLSCSLILQIELEAIPGLLGDWARISFQSIPIEINAAAAEHLRIGEDLCRDSDSGEGLMDRIIDCRIIIADIIHQD